MKCYRVGGAVRDELLGLPVHDTDWVVVGATPQALAALGYRPVGADFPVFLHPVTNEEYALARTERKTAPGYKGFVFHYEPGVTLEQDLARRDLTINAMARAEDGSLVDPFGGRRDLAQRVLRHVGDAFVEDPVRVLRVARFAARFPEFTVAPETMTLMRAIVAAGELDALVPERVWQELARGLMSASPSRMIAVMRACGALARLLPEVDALWPGPDEAATAMPIDRAERLARALDAGAAANHALEARFAVLLLDACGRTDATGPTGAARGSDAAAPDERAAACVDSVSARIRAPGACRELARALARERSVIGAVNSLDATAVVALVDRLDLVRRPARLAPLLQACAASGLGEPGARLHDAVAAVRTVDAGAIAAGVARAPATDARPLAARIAGAVRAAREVAVEAMRASRSRA